MYYEKKCISSIYPAIYYIVCAYLMCMHIRLQYIYIYILLFLSLLYHISFFAGSYTVVFLINLKNVSSYFRVFRGRCKNQPKKKKIIIDGDSEDHLIFSTCASTAEISFHLPRVQILTYISIYESVLIRPSLLSMMLK